MIPPRSSSRVKQSKPPSSRPTSPSPAAIELHLHSKADWASTFPAGRNSPNHHVVQITAGSIVEAMEAVQVERGEDSVEIRSLSSPTFQRSPHVSSSTRSTSLHRSETDSVASTHRTNATSICPLQAREGLDLEDLYPLFEELEPGICAVSRGHGISFRPV